MKSKRSALLLSLALLGVQSLFAQTDAIEVVTGGSFGKPKIMPHLEKFALAQLSVTYKLTSTEHTIGKERATGKMAGAKLTAFLETTDGELTSADFQEITDHFYNYFQQKLKQNGVDTVAWSTITAQEFYKDADGKVETGDEEKGNGQVWVTHNAHNGNIMYGGRTAFAFGKIKKAARFCDEIGAPAGFFHLVVDFADLAVNVKINTGEWQGYFEVKRTTTTSYKASAKPVMKIVPPTQTGRSSLLWNEKQQGESIVVRKEIESNIKYHNELIQDPSRLKSNLFGFAKSMDPVVVETTKAQYKAAAKSALEKYADVFIAKALEMKK